MSIAPLVHTVQVKTPPARAFDLFVTRMEHWWPKGHYRQESPRRHRAGAAGRWPMVRARRAGP